MAFVQIKSTENEIITMEESKQDIKANSAEEQSPSLQFFPTTITNENQCNYIASTTFCRLLNSTILKRHTNIQRHNPFHC